MSRCDACLKVTSSPPSRIRPEVGSSRPAIMRSVVVLPQPEGPSRQKKSPSGTVKVEPRTARNSPKLLRRFSTRISAMALLRELRDEGEQRGPHQGGEERVRVERHRKRLQQHQHARGNGGGGDPFHRPAPQPSRPPAPGVQRRHAHLRTAPKVMPRKRFFRSSTVNTRMGTRNSVVPAATAGQSWPPSPMMMGMKGGAVCACPEVSSVAKAYSFQAKMRQKIAVATIPVAAWGRTTFRKACRRVYPSTNAASSYSRGISSMNPLSSQTASDTLTAV